MCKHTCVEVLLEVRACVGSWNGCELPDLGIERGTLGLQEHQVLLAAEASVQPLETLDQGVKGSDCGGQMALSVYQRWEAQLSLFLEHRGPSI